MNRYHLNVELNKKQLFTRVIHHLSEWSVWHQLYLPWTNYLLYFPITFSEISYKFHVYWNRLVSHQFYEGWTCPIKFYFLFIVSALLSRICEPFLLCVTIEFKNKIVRYRDWVLVLERFLNKNGVLWLWELLVGNGYRSLYLSSILDIIHCRNTL